MKNSKHIFEILTKQKKTLKDRYKLKKIGLFGSFVKNHQTSRSDLDILVEFQNGEETFDNYMDLKFYLEDTFGKKVDLVLKSVLREELKKEILTEVVYV